MIRMPAQAHRCAAFLTALALSACGSAPQRPAPPPTRPAPPVATTKPAPPSAAQPAPPLAARPPRWGGGYYLDDGPGDAAPPNLESLPDPEPKREPLHRFANNPYSVLGQDFVPERALKPFRQRGMASWYGRRFHGNKTSSGEVYDMFQLSAAHPTLPIPSYARVTNTQNGRQVIVRVNDRGPFLHSRVIDLSYAAALKLGYIEQGTAEVDIETIVLEELDAIAAGGTPAPVGGPDRMLEMRPNEKGFPLYNERAGVFVQVGAFALPENADTLRARLALELSGVIRSVQVVLKDGLHRIWVGPYRTPAEARVAAARIASALP